MQVLTVARWYPSHDSPGRGSFVSDLVAATVEAGVDARVASFDRVLVHGRRPEQMERLHAKARAAYDVVATPDALFTLPRSRGARGVPVARIPVVQMPGTEALLDDHLAALQPFVADLVGRWRPDVIHAHTGLPDGIVAAEVGREHRIPVVVTEHASTIETVLADPVAAGRYRTLLEPDVRLLAVSPSLATRLAKLLDVEPDRIQVLPNPVADGNFPLGDGADRDPEQLLWVGSIGGHKDIDVLLRAFAQLRERRPGLQLQLIGAERKAGDRAALEALARELKVADDVRFDDWLDRKSVADAMLRSAVFVHPSPSETFGVVAAEAMLTGLPVATRRSGGVPWVVERSGGFGAVAADDGIASFANAIEAVLDGGLPVDAATARSRLVGEFSSDAVAEEALGHYRAVVDLAHTTDGHSEARISSPLPETSGPLPRLLVARGRNQAERHVPYLPEDLRHHLVLVVPQRPPGAPPVPLDDLGMRLVEVDLTTPQHDPSPGPFARLWRRLRQIRHRGKPPTAAVLFRDAVRATADTVRQGRAAVDVVAIDAPAAAVVARMDEAGVRLAPGSLRWLADRWDAEGDSLGLHAP